jgi:hypothetical protein
VFGVLAPLTEAELVWLILIEFGLEALDEGDGVLQALRASAVLTTAARSERALRGRGARAAS